MQQSLPHSAMGWSVIVPFTGHTRFSMHTEYEYLIFSLVFKLTIFLSMQPADVRHCLMHM